MARKAAVIADSDEESDADIAPSLPHSQAPPGAEHGQTHSDVDLGVNFSDFLSQSLRYDMNETQPLAPQQEQPEGAEKSTGTTASLKRQIESEQRKLAEQKSSSSGQLSYIKTRPEAQSSDSPIVAKTKRRHSELGSTGWMDGVRDTKRRRENTYGSSNSSSRLRSSQNDYFTEEHQVHDAASMVDMGSKGVSGEPLDSPEGDDLVTDQQADVTVQGLQNHMGDLGDQADNQSALHNTNAIQPQHLESPSANSDAFQKYMQTSSGRICTSRSILGNHESINVYYNGNVSGLDASTSPFGDTSQQSNENHIDTTEQERLEAIFRPPPAGTGDTVRLLSNRDGYSRDTLRLHQYGTDGATSMREANSSLLGSGRSKSFVDPSLLTKDPLDDTHQPFGIKTSLCRKRRKTADGLDFDTAFATHEVDSLPIKADALETPPPKVSAQGKKRGRKPKNHIVEPIEGIHPDHSTEQDEHENDEVHAKDPSSHLQIVSDESTIGLPQEHYKPRPSRSRSKRIADDEMPPPAHTPSKSVQTPLEQNQTPDDAAHDTSERNEPEDTPLTKPRKEKKGKNKMKRAKTSAAALLKNSDRMLSDGEEDVVWVESKPAAVKMKLPDPVGGKREEGVKPEVITPKKSKSMPDDPIDVANEEQARCGATTKEAPGMCVSTPPAEDSEPPKPPPKKRGRKKKSPAVEQQQQQQPLLAESEDSSTEVPNPAAGVPMAEPEDNPNRPNAKPSSSRQALKEKDINTTSSSRLVPDDDDAELESSDSPEKQQQQQQPPMPQAKSKESCERGPTKHSPINPTGGRVNYRVGLSRRATIPPLLKIVRK